jgi:hypothetical protein
VLCLSVDHVTMPSAMFIRSDEFGNLICRVCDRSLFFIASTHMGSWVVAGLFPDLTLASIWPTKRIVWPKLDRLISSLFPGRLLVFQSLLIGPSMSQLKSIGPWRASFVFIFFRFLLSVFCDLSKLQLKNRLLFFL